MSDRCALRISSRLPLAPSVTTINQVYADAGARAPAECCGFLSLHRGHEDFFRCVNRAEQGLTPDATASTHNSYRIDDEELLRLHHHVDDEQRQVIVYHSHLEVGAYLSTLDLEASRTLGLRVRQLVVDVRGGRCVGARLFTPLVSRLSQAPATVRGTFNLHESHRFNARGQRLHFGADRCDVPVLLAAYDAAILSAEHSAPEAAPAPGMCPPFGRAEPHRRGR